MTTTVIKNGAGTDVTVELPLAPGRAAATASRPVVLSTEDLAALSAAKTISGSVAVTGTFYQATQPVSLASQPLPTGASTEATLAAMSAKLPAALVGGALSVALGQSEYETVAASQTAQTLGATGGTGDYLAGLLVIPATSTPGLVTVLDNATSIPVFVGGASSVSNLVPFYVPIGARSVSGAWKVTTGANVSVWAFGDFT